MENVKFILVCLAIFAGLFLLALWFEKLLVKNRKKLSDTHYITYTAVLSAVAELDLSELPVLICTFYLGPVAGVVSELLKVCIKLILKGTTTAFVGDFANFAVGCSFVLPASIFYHSRPSRKRAILGLVVGTLVMTVFGSAFNAVYLLPKFSALFGMPLDVIVGMGTKVNGAIQSVSTLVLFAVVPFNLLKGVVVSLLTMLLYKRISPLLHLGDDRKKERKAQQAK